MFSNSCYQVVAFKACLLPPHNTKNIEQFTNHSQLLNQDVRSLVSLCLVLRNRFMTESRFGSIEHHNHTIRLVIAHKSQQHRCKAIHGVCYLAAGISHIFWQRIERSISQRIAVKRHDQHGEFLISIRGAVRQQSPCQQLPS